MSYNPVAGTLTLFPRISADVSLEGGFIPRDAVSPLPGLRGVVLNPEVLPAAPRGIGNYLIIVANAYAPLIQPFASAKSDQGFTVTTWVPPSASNTVIKTYIQSLWGTSNAPDYVLLVGDTDTIPHWTGGGEGSPSTDIPYVCMDGASDWYPDIAIGRFPVRTAAQFQAIVDKTLLYENGPLPDPGYMNRAVFMASSDNYTVSEGTHNWVIDTYMTPHGIVSDKLYCHTYSATPQQVSNSFNNGRFFGIYSGHGANTYWADGPVFYQSDVNALTNVGMYSFVCSFACVTGTYTDSECFVETWVRAPNKGAVAMYGSSVNSYWTEDDVMERRLFDSIYDDTDPVVAEAGPVWNDARMRYLAEMGSGQTTRRYFEMYNLMGDPALPFFGPNTPPHGLKVTPEDELHAEGPAGGPFTPGSIVYTVKNAGETPMNYAVSKSAQWLSITNATGTLAPRASITVTASINAGANSLGNGLYNDTLAFINTTDHDGDTSRPISVKIGVPQPVLTWPLDTDPGWARQTQWAFGQPTGHGGGTYGGPDPVSGATGTNVFGVNLNGNYAITLDGAHYLTLGPVNLTGITGVILKFQRWLNSDFQPWVSNTIEVSNDNSHWTQVWVNGESEIADRAWSLQSCDIAAVADDRAAVYIRWGYRILRHDAVPYSGWNIDDVEIWGLVAGPAGCPGDANCDDGVNWRDIDYFVSALNSQVAWTAMFAPGTPTCPFSNNDANGDGSVNWRDIDSLVTLMGTVCP